MSALWTLGLSLHPDVIVLLTSLFFSSLLYPAAGLGWSVKPVFAVVPKEELIELLSSNDCQDDVLSTKATQQEVVVSLAVGEK